jgi:hypothetical protein
MSRARAVFDLPDGWQQELIALYGEGGSDAEARSLIRKWRGTFGKPLWIRWLEEETEFAEIIEDGRDESEAWWTRMGREGAIGHIELSVGAWVFNMKNRFNWRDRQDVDHKHSFDVVEVGPDQIVKPPQESGSDA